VSLELSSHPCGLSYEPPYFDLWCASAPQTCDLLSDFETSSFGGSALWRGKVKEFKGIQGGYISREFKEDIYGILSRF